MTVSMGLVFCIAMAFLVFNARYRGQPEPPNNRIKLPLVLLETAFFAVLVSKGEHVVLSSILIVVGIVTAGFILAGRNPWWLQGSADRWMLRRRSRS
ncbi:MAG: hypothetical protein ACLQBY_18490 [Solirubrobacteraceae bacterium]